MGVNAESSTGQSQLEHVTTMLRARILSGAFGPGTRLMEVPLAEMLGTSRTPVRLALSILQQERLVVAAGHRRGFTVNGFTLEEVFAAIETRGALEAMAARQAAEQGLAEADAAGLRACLAEGDALIARDLTEPGWDTAWAANNLAFHEALVATAGNRAIQLALEPLNRIPLAAPATLVLRTADREADLSRLQRAHADHRDILEAVEAGQGSRAEALLREHAALNIRNKRRNFAEIKARKAAGDFPGLDLVGEAPSAIPAPRRARRRNRD